MAAALVSPHNRPDYFALFGLKRRFSVDRTALERKFYELSRASHPDRFTTAGPLAQAEAVQRMSELNEAYRTLKDPGELRQYYLKLEGFELPSERGAPGCVTGMPHQTSVATPGSGIPMELAESWFELQDALMEADDPWQASQRIAAFERELGDLRNRGSETLIAIERAIDEAAEASSTGVAPRGLLEKLAQEIRAQSYLKSMERDVERIKKRHLG